MAFERLAGKRINGHLGRLPLAHICDVGFVDLHFSGDNAHVGNRHQVTAFGVLNSGYDIFAHAHSDVTDNPIDRRLSLIHI